MIADEHDLAAHPFPHRGPLDAERPSHDAAEHGLIDEARSARVRV
jgi:hypothetical protein